MTDTPKTEPKRISSHSSLFSSKKKLAPRSSLQFKIGPQFTPTLILNQITSSKGEQVTPVLTPRIDRGFERIDDEWVGYKRNYFTLVSAFYFEDVSFLTFAAEYYYTIDPETNLKTRIKYFGIRLVSKCADDDTSVSLVQHTAKRDRGPQFEPPTHPAVPSDLPDHNIIREAANVRNTSKIAKLNRIFFFDKDNKNHDELSFKGLLDYPSDKIIKVARYERIQFSSSINYKKPTLNNKRYKLLVELVGFTDLETCVPLAYTETPPLIVRGRSPSNYQGLETDQFDTDVQSSIQSTPFENLDDFDTYQILKMATEDLELSPSVQAQPKKKRGRKPKPRPSDENSSVIKKPKKLKEPKCDLKESKKFKLKRRKLLKEASPGSKKLVDDELLRQENNNDSYIHDFSLLYTPTLAAKKGQLIKDDNELALSDFDDSAHLVDLFDTQMHYNTIQPKPTVTSLLPPMSDRSNLLQPSTLETYEDDFFLLKNRLEQEKSTHHFHDDFANMNPSAMLGFDEDGPSFISYS